MTSIRSARIASVMAGCALALTLAPPVANADPVADIRGTVTRDRINSGCPEMKYNQTLQDVAFMTADFIPEPPSAIDAKKAQYSGQIQVYRGDGDPMADALTKAYASGGGSAIGDCSTTDYGVSFRRNEAYDPEDIVGLVFGKASVTTPPSGPGAPGAPGGDQKPAEQAPPPPPPPPPPVTCPPGGPQKEVPAGQTCPPPTNAVRVTFDRGFGFWTVNVKNNAGIGGSCTYRATSGSGLTGASEDFDITPNGSASFSVPAPAPFTTYNVVTSCTGTYDGKQVEFGRDVQNVSL